ncbi:preQ(1) synthase [Deinococcus radiophilus]|uniref:NADPH-dependent 7-cyano-7-deazaguanine reductase n=1 Tax=Deinococcus radiophilus TaxID=32062 RepID=A0A431W5X8_9DEIO|nr:preQ(1) synthase [Deinococcus radiophilus]RTR30857.1 NADPH-dependent 7-cyano-7-deazaguanine reductase QueF [Deinococcus radiophilus]UFA49438.1 preQ(1) synthase [Deinococcus radiophilus]
MTQTEPTPAATSAKDCGGFDRRYDVQGLDAIDVAVLDTFAAIREDDPVRYPGEPSEIVISTDEFSPVCPWSGLPDFGRLEIRYVPREKCVELKSLKYYLTSYRFVGIYHEHATRRVLADLVALLDPLRLSIDCDYGLRGGIRTAVKANYVAEDQK